MDYKAVLSGANGWRAESGKLDVGFLVAPLFKKEKRCKSLNFKEIRGFFFSKNRQN
jgi:hypothetical protein